MCSLWASGSILRISEGRYWGNFGRVERVDTCRAWRCVEEFRVESWE